MGSFVPKLAAKSFEKYGFSSAAILTDWAAVAGAELAACSEPERLNWPRRYSGAEDAGQPRSGATLVLRVEPARALDVQYKSQQIVERINAYFGYRAVTAVRLLQAPLASGRPAPRSDTPRAVLGPPLAEVARIQDAGLRQALEKLGASVGASTDVRASRHRDAAASC